MYYGNIRVSAKSHSLAWIEQAEQSRSQALLSPVNGAQVVVGTSETNDVTTLASLSEGCAHVDRSTPMLRQDQTAAYRRQADATDSTCLHLRGSALATWEDAEQDI